MGIVIYAYRIPACQVTGVPHTPNWYAIDVETSPDATDDQIRLMCQSLLADRFKFRAHRETRRFLATFSWPRKAA
jgi:uncharacterized protein (TIGR03435 family)